MTVTLVFVFRLRDVSQLKISRVISTTLALRQGLTVDTGGAILEGSVALLAYKHDPHPQARPKGAVVLLAPKGSMVLLALL